MFGRFNISDEDWQHTPVAVQQAFSSIYHQLLLLEIRCQAYELQLAQLRQQVAQIEDLKAELAELRERLRQNSNNSSKPPSSDPPHQPHNTSAESSGRKHGAQHGHRGLSRKLKAATQVDRVIDLKPISCKDCGQLLLGDDPQPARHQVSDVPRCKAQVTEYRRHSLHCLVCGAVNRADWPEDMPVGSFGPRVQAVAAYLTGRLAASHRDVSEVMEVLHGVKVSLGSVSSLQQRVSQSLEVAVEQAKQYARSQLSQNVDETSWPQARKPKWLWVNATRDVTVYHLLEGRATKQAKQVISEQAKGIIGTDRFGAYNWLPARRRQICWAHLKRDFQAVAERGGQSAQVGEALLKEVEEVFKLWHQLRDRKMSRKQLQLGIAPVEQRVKGSLKRGSCCEQKKTRRTCERILKLRRSLWRFVQVEGIEPTNNSAATALRRAVLWRRKSFGTQSEAGSRFVERILTVVMSLRQQGRDVLEELTALCSHQPRSLLPDIHGLPFILHPT
jgi:predicted Zn-ribbon and HTH transcriptional regulator